MTDPDKVATGKAIILEIVRCMRENLEPLLFSTVAPVRYYVYLHRDDFSRLEGIFPVIVEQARRALDEEVKSWNAAASGRSAPLRWLTAQKSAPPIDVPPDGWEIAFEVDTDEEMHPGDIAIASELSLPRAPDFAGSKTRRVTTTRFRSGEEGATRREVIDNPAPDPPVTGVPGPAAPMTAAPTAPAPYATLTYEDQQGRRSFAMTKNEIVIGRGGVGYWVDVKLVTSPDVSREHLRLRRDEASGKFFVKDLSSLGTTVDGQAVPSSVEIVDGRKRDKGIETELPGRARIGLADTVIIEFEATGR